MPAITRWSRSSVCSGRAAFSSGRRSAGGSGQASGPSDAIDLLVLERVGAQELDPRRLLGAELAQAQLAGAWVEIRTSSREVRSRGPARLS